MISKMPKEIYSNTQLYLGDCYFHGATVPQDYKQAAYWYKEAATQDDSDAQINLGRCYYNGNGVNRCYKKSAYWFRKAAEQNSGEGQYLLALSYLNGKGVSKNYPLYRYWFSQSAKNGGPASAYGFSYQCEADYTHTDYVEVILRCRNKADQGDAEAQINLGYCYQYGECIQKNINQSIYWYNEAAKQNHPAAIFFLNLFYSHLM